MATEYISTETGCQYLRKYKIEDGTSFLYDEGFNDGIETAISCIGNEVPAADVRSVKHGEWIVDDPGEYQLIECDQCHAQMWNHQSELPNYCYECGADMRPERGTKE